jgi:site-specific DNA-cytosine methylase
MPRPAPAPPRPQGISGLNQHRLLSDVLRDPKNRLMTTYMRLVEFLEPNFILMEQVGGGGWEWG